MRLTTQRQGGQLAADPTLATQGLADMHILFALLRACKILDKVCPPLPPHAAPADPRPDPRSPTMVFVMAAGDGLLEERVTLVQELRATTCGWMGVG